MGAADEVLEWLGDSVDLVGLAVGSASVGFAHGNDKRWWDCGDPVELVAVVEAACRPRWVMWSSDTASVLVAGDLRVSRCWDIAAVHRLLTGGWRADAGRTWAVANGLDVDGLPTSTAPDLFTVATDDGDAAEPIRPDGYLRPDWVEGTWTEGADRVSMWAGLALRVAEKQRSALRQLVDRPRAEATARSESAAELLCAELAVDGLPMRRSIAEAMVCDAVGLRARNGTEAAERRRVRDALVFAACPDIGDFDLRSPGQVKSLLRRVGIEVVDTRAWRLETLRAEHPVIDALLQWRKSERIATTFGYEWLDRHLGPDDRLRGAWTGCDGAAGRMTASAGLHNMPADFRPAVCAEPGHVFVRADLGQIEPRVLAAVSGDGALARATQDDDMYAPVATRLGVDRATAKVAVLGAMYGQTTGHGAQALRGLASAYPVAMGYLDTAAQAGQVGRELRTYGGRLIRMGMSVDSDLDERDARSRAAARGRYGRNAMIQGAAAELFKVWAVTVRARGAEMAAQIVLCLHDELLVHVPSAHAEAAAALVDECLQEAAYRWAPDRSVRFLADVRVIDRWSDAKD